MKSKTSLKLYKLVALELLGILPQYIDHRYNII